MKTTLKVLAALTAALLLLLAAVRWFGPRPPAAPGIDTVSDGASLQAFVEGLDAGTPKELGGGMTMTRVTFDPQGDNGHGAVRFDYTVAPAVDFTEGMAGIFRAESREFACDYMGRVLVLGAAVVFHV